MEFCKVSSAFSKLKKKRKNSTSPIILNFCIDFRKSFVFKAMKASLEKPGV